MSKHTIVIDATRTGVSFDDMFKPGTMREACNELSKYFARIAGGDENAKIWMQTKAVPAVNAITLASHVATDTVTINGVALTCVATGATPTNTQYNEGASTNDEITANNLRATINACTSAKIRGQVYATRSGTLAFSSFANGDTVTVNGVVFTGKTTPDAAVKEEFKIGGSNTITADNFVLAVLRTLNIAIQGGLVSVSNSSGTVTIVYDGALTLAASAHCTVANKIVNLTAVEGGAIGNLYTLAISAHGSVTGANFASGTDGSFYKFTQI